MTDKVDFTGIEWGSVEWTMLCTLYMRAHESRSEHSILGDHAAAEAVDRIDYDFERLDRRVRPSSSQYIVALRGKKLDMWAEDFLGRHPDAVVLQLGCGLDSRSSRLRVPEGVQWIDVDVPQVIELRGKVYSEHDGYRMLASSVTDSAWLEEIPVGHPVLVVAEGLLPYLTGNEARELLARITDRFDSGEIVFDTVPPWIARTNRFFRWGLRDATVIERWNPKLKCLDQTTLLSLYSWIPAGRYRTMYKLFGKIPFMRTFSPMFRFGFPASSR